MGAIVNGMALSRPARRIGSTFLIFSDYMKPPIRLSAIMELPVDLRLHARFASASARTARRTSRSSSCARCAAIPGLMVLRPGDANEVAEAGARSCTVHDQPACAGARRGRRCRHSTAGNTRRPPARRRAPMCSPRRPTASREVILIATGSEVRSARRRVREARRARASRARVVSMPSWELFEAQADSLSGTACCRRTSTARVAVEQAARWAGTAMSAAAAR